MSTPRPSKADRREEARQAALRVKEQQEREAKRQRTILFSIIGVAVVALVAVIAFIFANAPDESSRIATIDFSESEDPIGEVTRPAGSTDDGGILLGPDGVITSGDVPADATVVSVYQDFLCPICGSFEQVNGQALDQLRADGTAVVKIHPVAILDGASAGSQYSTRSATAFALVADRAPEAAADFNALLFANQPSEGGAGLTDAQIAELAASAGAPEDVVAAIEDGSYVRGEGSFRPWVAATTEQAARDLPRLATPTVFVDDAELSQLGVDWRVPGALTEAVQQARG